MYKALVIKELRETAWIAAVTLAAYALVVMEMMGYSLWSMRWEPLTIIPFQYELFAYLSALIAAACGILIGFRQSAWESLRGTSIFLLHRPLSRRALFGTRLTAGLAILLITTGLPLLAYSLWAATPGTHASPFYWSMTAQCWFVWFDMTIAYLAAFLTGIRNARWFCSRLFPLLGALFPVVIAMETLPVPGLRWLIVIVADAVLLTAIFYVVENRDYP
jgi:ABC-type transport system involved in multi-copper enzyme maturation permease subunit